jgi:hypothetical protein
VNRNPERKTEDSRKENEKRKGKVRGEQEVKALAQTFGAMQC